VFVSERTQFWELTENTSIKAGFFANDLMLANPLASSSKQAFLLGVLRQISEKTFNRKWSEIFDARTIPSERLVGIVLFFYRKDEVQNIASNETLPKNPNNSTLLFNARSPGRNGRLPLTPKCFS